MRFKLKALSCTNCATAIEASILEIPEVSHVQFNFATEELTLGLHSPLDDSYSKIKSIVHRFESDIEVISLEDNRSKTVFFLDGLHCMSCSEKIYESLKHEFSDFEIVYSVSTGKLTFTGPYLENLRSQIQAIVDRIEEGVFVVPIDEYDVSQGEDKASGSGSHISRKFLRLVEKVTARQWRILIGSLAFMGSLAADFLSIQTQMMSIFYFISYIIVGYPVLRKAFKNLARGFWLDENFLMSIATLGAILLGEMPEAVGVMLFYEVGEHFQDLAVNRSRNAVKSLLDIRPDKAHLIINGEDRLVPAKVLKAGDFIRVKPGERVPVDAIITDYEGQFDTSAMTGESVPRNYQVTEEVLSGFILIDKALVLKATKDFEHSSASRLIELVEHATEKKAKTERFMTTFARYYTPVVVVLSLLIATLVPIILAQPFSVWAYRALIFLVISCPCALVISIPLSYFAGVGAASKRGILVKGGNYLDALSEVKHVVFDKTGTLTEGKFEIRKIYPSNEYTSEEVLKLAAIAEQHSNHPIAKAIVKAYEKTFQQRVPFEQETVEHSGQGIVSRGSYGQIVAGKLMFIKQYLLSPEIITPHVDGTLVSLAHDGRYAGAIHIADTLKPNAREVIDTLESMGIMTSIFTGDREEAARPIASALGIKSVLSDLFPKDKLDLLEKLLVQHKKGKVAFVGDGINDAPVLARADIGISMGELGSDVAIEASDVVIMGDELIKIPMAIKLAKETRSIVYQNIILALGVKLLFLILGLMGIAGMWEAIFADVGVALLAVLNASRMVREKE
jgi:Cd2+/Zn2+-exporting ATPase